MRRSILLLAIASSAAAIVACEDGPNQTFNPAPAGAATTWNNGNTPPAVGNANQGFGSTTAGGTNAVNICTGDELQKRWSKMVREPLFPPQFAGGLDMAGGESWQGLTINDAEKINCQATADGNQFAYGSTDLTVEWGNNGEIQASYGVNNLKIDAMAINVGYLGAMGCTGMEPAGAPGTPDAIDSPSQPPGVACTQLQTSPMSKFGQHTYVIPLNAQITKDSQPFTLDWVGAGGFGTDPASGPGIIEEVDQLASAIFSTYFPGLQLIDNCAESGFCIVNHFGDTPYIFIAPAGIGPLFASYVAGPQVASTAEQYQIYLTKIVPYSFNNPLLKMDAVGPTATATALLGVASQPCVLQMGLDWMDFKSNCVATTGDPMKDTVAVNKVLGGITHDDETWSFDVQGVDLSFADSTLTDTQVVTDGSLPTPGDKANFFWVDQSTIGSILNDFTDATATTLDLHGTGAIAHEFARAAIQDLRAAACAEPTGAPAWCSSAGYVASIAGGANFTALNQSCLSSTSAILAAGSPAAYYAGLPGWCTGLEGTMTPASAATFTATATDPLLAGDVGLNVLNLVPNAGQGMKPGSTQIEFCADANGDLSGGTGYNLCGVGADPGFGMEGDIFSTSFLRAVEVFGQGNVNNMPPSAQDRRFFFKEYVLASVRYFTGPGIGGGTGTSYAMLDPVPSLQNVKIDLNSIYFDSQGDGQFEQGEYVDRRFVTATNPPLDMEIGADVLNGIFNNWQFNKYLYRGETAYYAALTTTAGDPIGSEDTGILTNAFGNPILLNWPGGATTASPYQCATTAVGFPNYDAAIDADCQAGGSGVPTSSTTGLPLLDDNGDLLFTGYPGAVPSSPNPLQPGTFVSQSVFSLTCAGGTYCGSSTMPVITVTPQVDANGNNFFQQAMVSVPTFSDPYNPASVPGAAIQKLLQFIPKQPGNGFNVPVTGGTNYFVEANLVDFSGITVTSPIFYDCAIDPATNQCATNGALQLEGVSSSDFLGKVFLCQEGADILAAQMYTPVNEILTWIEQHPGAYDGNNDCQLVLRYSPFNNYLDDITSLANGVTVEVTQGGGFGRIVGSTIFVPGQLGIGQ